MKWLKDWWRGYSDRDIASAKRKFLEHIPKPGGVIFLTKEEMKAIIKENIEYDPF